MHGRILPVTLAALVVGVPAAYATTEVGDSSQSGTQNFTANQGLTQAASGNVPGASSNPRTGENQSGIVGVNVQQNGAGNGADVIVGTSRQSSAQNTATSQDLTGVSTAKNGATTALINVQDAAGGGVTGGTIVGSPKQSNAQNSTTSQSASRGGSALVISNPTQSAQNSQSTSEFNCQSAGATTTCL